MPVSTGAGKVPTHLCGHLLFMLRYYYCKIKLKM
jgi:hypothetical protein